MNQRCPWRRCRCRRGGCGAAAAVHFLLPSRRSVAAAGYFLLPSRQLPKKENFKNS